MTPGFTIDLAYRYTDLGDAKTGKTFTYDNAVTAGSFEIEDITSHNVMLSVRWALGKQSRADAGRLQIRKAPQYPDC